MNTLSIEIPEALNARLIAVARRRCASEAELISEALLDYLARQEAEPAPDSFAALAAEILDAPGDDFGPTDLSVNPQHLEGYGQ